MPVRYVIEKQRRLVITTATDRITFAEVNAYQDKLKGDRNFQPEFNQVVDATAVTAVDMSADEARAIVSREVFSATSRHACIAKIRSDLMKCCHEHPYPSLAWSALRFRRSRQQLGSRSPTRPTYAKADAARIRGTGRRWRNWLVLASSVPRCNSEFDK